MKCFKGLLLLLFFISFTQTNAQTLKRKFCGIYKGTIPSYEVQMGPNTYPVAQCGIEVCMSRDSLWIEMGTYQYGASFAVEISKKKLKITAVRSNSGIPEELLLDTKTRTLTRSGVFPQPSAVLQRTGRLAGRKPNTK